MKTIQLPEFVDFLCGLKDPDFKGEKVDRYLTDHRIEEDSVLPFVYFREETYGRNLIFKNESFELLTLCWLPQQRTPIHDHAGQRCWMVMQTGTLTFKNFEPIDNDNSPLIPCGKCETRTEGAAVYIDDGIGIHSIANASVKPAISLHLYAGPIPTCKIYDEAIKRFRTIELRYFTHPDFFAPQKSGGQIANR